MKNFKKALAILTAVSSFAASSSAFAAVNFSNGANDLSCEWTTAGKLDVTVPTGVKTGSEMTLVVLKEGSRAANDNGGYTYTISDGNILYIDQQTEGTSGAFQGMGMKDADFATTATTGEGHIIRLGYYDADGNFAIKEALATVGSDAKTVTLKWGNLDGNATVDTTDALMAILAYGGTNRTVTLDDVDVTIADATNSNFTVVGGTTDNNTVVWGNLDGNTTIDTTDALMAILAYGGTNRTVNVCGKSVTVGVTNATIDLTNKTITFAE